MGMDIHGINPKMNKSKDQYNIYLKWKDIYWNVKENEKKEEWEKEKETFHLQMNKYETDNKGVYFRNNCWSWRPLWDYCREIAPDLISRELWNSGHHNDGAGLDADDSKKLGNRLMEYIADGRTMKYQEDYRKAQKNSDDGFASGYPFDVDNVEEFALFCIESGGFEIC